MFIDSSRLIEFFALAERNAQVRRVQLPIHCAPLEPEHHLVAAKSRPDVGQSRSAAN